MADPKEEALLPTGVGIGAESLAQPQTTEQMTPPCGDDASEGPISGKDASDTKETRPGNPDERDDVADGTSDSKLDPRMDDQLRILSRIGKLQDELVKVERNTRLEQKLESLESLWDQRFEKFGRDSEQYAWGQTQEMRARSFVKDTTAFALGREWARESEESFIWKMLEREDYDKTLIERRAQWEAKKGITQPKADDSLKPKATWPAVGFHRPSQIDAFLDPLSDESKFNATPEARGYDAQERLHRSQIHEIVRSKHDAFMRWKTIPKGPPKAAEFDITDEGWPRPIIRYMQWKIFKECSPVMTFEGKEKQHLSAMDVLDGEPDLSTSTNSYSWIQKVRDDESGLPAGIPNAAQGKVPERVRLNGPHFIHIMRDLCLVFPAFPSQVQSLLLQPYRVLVYHEKDIRKRQAILKQKLEASDDSRAVHSDTVHVQHENTDEETEPYPKGEKGTESDQHSADATQHAGGAKSPQQLQDKPSEENYGIKSPLANTKTTLAYLNCLVEFIDTTISIRRKFVQGPECQRVHFRDLWYLFNPGDEIVGRDEKQVYRVIGVLNPKHVDPKNNFLKFDEEDTSRYFQIECVHLDFDGRRFGPVSTNFLIKTFEGEKSVESLEVYPLRLHKFTAGLGKKGHSKLSEPQTLRSLLIQRGRKFFRAARMQLENTFYDGPTASGDEIESQVVVDFETALSSDNNFDDEMVPRIKSILDDSDDSTSEASVSPTHPRIVTNCYTCCNGEQVCDDTAVERKRREAYIDSLIPKGAGAKLPSIVIYPRYLDDLTGENDLTDDEYLLMSYRVFAFILRTRKWGEFCFFVVIVSKIASRSSFGDFTVKIEVCRDVSVGYARH